MTDQLVLPDFEGRSVFTTKTTLTGQTPDRTRPFRIGERFYIAAEVLVTSVDHAGGVEGGVVRKHVLKVTRMGELDEAIAEEVLAFAEAEARRAEDLAQGREPLFDDAGNPVAEAVAEIEPEPEPEPAV